jgi:hypothetical protein
MVRPFAAKLKFVIGAASGSSASALVELEHEAANSITEHVMSKRMELFDMAAL